jgi:hypothetical protein
MGLIVALAGCDRSVDGQLYGTWAQAAHGDSFFEQMLIEMMPKVKVTFNPDHTFSMKVPTFELTTVGNTSTFFSRKVIEGTWKVDGRTAVFDPRTSDGKSVTLIRAEMATAATAAKLQEHDRMVQEAVRQQLATQGRAGTYSGHPSQSAPEQLPSYAKASNELVLPDRAELSKGGNKLRLRFQDGNGEVVVMERDE